MNFRVCLLLFGLSCWSNLCVTQTLGFSLGISVDFGTEVKRIGLRCDMQTAYKFVQGNVMAGVFYNFTSWGVKAKTPEVKIGGGAHFGFGQKDKQVSKFIGLSENNLLHHFVVGYAYQYYFDWQNTSQGSGLIAVNYRHFSIITENDLLGAGKGWRDRFRTGAFKVSYHRNGYKLSANFVMYTGDYASCTKITDDPSYPARFGYRAQDKAIYGDRSLGILSVQGEYVGPYSQVARVDIGLNSEKLRHAIQNKALHDMPFYTDKMVKRQLMHIPMLQSDGSIYTFKAGEKIRPGKLFYNVALNPSAFY